MMTNRVIQVPPIDVHTTNVDSKPFFAELNKLFLYIAEVAKEFINHLYNNTYIKQLKSKVSTDVLLYY